MQNIQGSIQNLKFHVGGIRFRSIVVDPPWQFDHRRGKVSPEHKRLAKYETMTLDEIMLLPIDEIVPEDDEESSHLYLWCPNAFVPQALEVMAYWGFTYKSNLIWHKIRKDGGSDGRCMGFYFRNVTEMVLFGVRGKKPRTREAGRRQVNLLSACKREHSRKPDELYKIVEACSHWPYAELFARQNRPGWFTWGDQIRSGYGLHVGERVTMDWPVMLGEYEVGSIAEGDDGYEGAFNPIDECHQPYYGKTVAEVAEKMSYESPYYA